MATNETRASVRSSRRPTLLSAAIYVRLKGPVATTAPAQGEDKGRGGSLVGLLADRPLHLEARSLSEPPRASNDVLKQPAMTIDSACALLTRHGWHHFFLANISGDRPIFLITGNN